MSTSPMLPESTSAQLKSFWARPEGKAAMGALLILLVVVGFNAATILAYFLGLLTDMVHITILVAELLAICWLLFSKRSHLFFRLLMRWITGLVIDIDPMGILEDHISQMKKRRAIMEQQISAVSGQIRFLKDTISKNVQAAQQNMRIAEQAKKMSSTQDSNEALRMQLQMRAKANKAGRLQQSNLSYQQLLDRLQKVYDMLTKFATHVDFFIEDTEDQVAQAKIQYKALNAGFKAFRTAMSVIRGNSDEDEIYNSTMERLAEEASQKLGEMEDFQRVSQGFIDTIDIQNAAVGEQALQQLDQYEQKLLTEGTKGQTAFLLPGAQQPQPQAIPINRPASAPAPTGTYDDLFKS